MIATILNTMAYNIRLSLYVMFQGMLGIFIFMAIFYALIYGLDRLYEKRKH